MKYYKLTIKKGHVGCGNAVYKTVYVATQASAATVFAKGQHYLLGCKGVVAVKEVSKNENDENPHLHKMWKRKK